MAVTNAYVDANISAGKLSSAAVNSGACQITAVQAYSVLAADDATSVLRFFKGIPSDAIIIDIRILNTAITGATGALIGLYDVLDFDGVGAAIDDNCFHTGFDLSSANAVASGWAEAMILPTIPNRETQLWEIAAQTQAPGAAGPKAAAYDIAIKLVNKTASATGDIAMLLTYVRGV